MDLGIDDGELAGCVSCGLCLPHCPTYRVTGEEALSPRGRIAAMRQVQWEGLTPDDSFVRSMETCVQCRGCETACPSGVAFGHLIEPTRTTMAEGTPGRGAGPADGPPAAAVDPPAGTLAGAPTLAPPGGALRRPPRLLRLALGALRWHRLVLAGSSALGMAQRMRVVPDRLARRLGLPVRVPIRRPHLTASGTGADPERDVWLHTGCVMDAWMRDVHADVQSVIEAAGGHVALPGPDGACCGALAHHAGLATAARGHAERTMRAFPGDAPILVDSAGCGAMLADYGHVLGTPAAAAFASRVQDVHTWLAARVDRLTDRWVDARTDAAAAPRAATAQPGTDRPDQSRTSDRPDRADRPIVTVQDPCHLRHVQRSHMAVRMVLAPFATIVELDDEGLCCGAGGAYAAVQPELAAGIRLRKLAAIGRSGAPVVASANPGCALHLAAAGATVVHPCQIVARALAGDPPTG